MHIDVASERVLLLKESLSMDFAEGRAWEKKKKAFGFLPNLNFLFNNAKDNDFKLIYKEQRYQPFWHIICSALYEYERKRVYNVTVGADVQSIKISGADYPISGSRLTLTGMEYCRKEPRQEAFFEGITRQRNPKLGKYLGYPATEISRDNLDTIAPPGSIVVPPQARASAIIQEVLSETLRENIEADHISEQHAEVERIDLYYRPVYAFRYCWLPEQKEAIMEFDGLTGEVEGGGTTFEGITFQQYLQEAFDRDFLIEIGMDAVNEVIPGGTIITKIIKHSLDAARSPHQVEPQA
jgi:hypothetical protein